MAEPDRFERRRARASELVTALEALGPPELDRGDAQRALERAFLAEPSREWHQQILAAAEDMGLAIGSFDGTPSDIVRVGFPVVTKDDAGAILVGTAPASVEHLEARRRTFLFARAGRTLDRLRGRSPGQRLVALVRLERDDLWVAITYAVAVGVLALATPLGVQTIVNTVAFGSLIQPLVILTVLVFAGLAFAGVLRALQAIVVEKVQQRLFVRTAIDFAYRVPRFRADARVEHHGPELLNRFFDVATVQKSAAQLLLDGVALALQTVVGMFLLGMYHPLLLGFAGVLAACIAFVVLVLGRGATASAVAESKAKYAVGAWLQEVARHEVLFGSRPGAAWSVRRVEELTHGWLSKRRKHFASVFTQTVGALVLQACASALLLGVGGGLVLAKQLTLGQLVAAELIVTAVVAGFSKMGKYLESYYDLVASADKLGAIVDLPLERIDGVMLPAGDDPVAVRISAVDGVSLDVPAGLAVALVTNDETRRAALADAVSLRRVPSAGRVEIGGSDTRMVGPLLARGDVALVRGPEIVAGSVLENVTVGRPATADEVTTALDIAGALDDVLALPRGLETVLATHGPSLSRDLATRLTLARVLLGWPRVLVLDGALDALSSRVALLERLRTRAGTTLLLLTRDAELAAPLPHVSLEETR